MATPVLYGPAYSTYTRSARLAFEEKGVAYELAEVDILKGAAQKPEHLARHPFAKVPALKHDGFTLYETSAILRYIDEGFPGAKLQPADVRQRARMAQMIAIIDAYGYGSMITKIFIQRVVTPMLGGTTDEAAVAGAAPLAAKSIAAVEALADGGSYLVGDGVSLADLMLAPVVSYFLLTDEGKKALAGAPKLSRWWQGISARPSVVKTQPSLG